MKFGLLRLITALILVSATQLFATSVRAAVVTWNVSLQFEDVTSFATGSFDYDATANVFSNINIVTDPAAFPFLGATYTQLDAAGGNAADFHFCSPCLVPGVGSRLDLALFAPMTDAGGVIGLAVGNEFVFGSPGMARFFIEGTVTASVVPLPAALPLFLSGLVAFVFVARRQRSRGSLATA